MYAAGEALKAVTARILSLDAKPETGVVAEIGPCFMFFKADQTNAYVVNAGHF